MEDSSLLEINYSFTPLHTFKVYFTITNDAQ
jgi:hypothetical protein